jgi:hypothetical protein
LKHQLTGQNFQHHDAKKPWHRHLSKPNTRFKRLLFAVDKRLGIHI